MMKALVVEDDAQHWLPALLRAVTAAGFEPIPILEATSATEILKYNPDIRLVILDWNLIAPGDLPSVTGEGIAAIAKSKGIPVIVISGAFHDPTFIEHQRILDVLDETHQLRDRYEVCRWFTKANLEPELAATPPLATLTAAIQKLALPPSQPKAIAADLPPQSPKLQPPYCIEIIGDQAQTPAVKIISQRDRQFIQVCGSSALSPYYAHFLEELCSAHADQDSIVGYDTLFHLIAETDATKKKKDAVEAFVEKFVQWLERNVAYKGKEGRKLIRDHLFNKVGDLGFRLSSTAKVNIQEHSPKHSQ